MYQVDTSLTMYTLKQAEAVIAQSNAMFSKMIDDSLALNRAMMDFSFIEMTPAETIELMFPSVASGDAKKNQLNQSVHRRPKRLHRRRFVRTI